MQKTTAKKRWIKIVQRVKILLTRSLFRETGSKKWLGEFCLQLSELMASGMALSDGLGILKTETPKGHQEEMLSALQKMLYQGARFSDALSLVKVGFPPLMIAMCRAGEKSGSLPEMLGHLGRYYQVQTDFEAMLAKALFYPGFVLLMTFGTMVFLSLWVLPVFEGLYLSMEAELPLLTRVVLNGSKGIPFLLTGLLAGAVGLPFFMRALKKNPELKKRWDAFWLKAPVIGEMVMCRELSCFFQALSMMTGGGVDLVSAMKTAMTVFKNDALREKMERGLNQIEKGAGVSRAFSEIRVLGERALKLLMMGEASGEMDRMFEKTAEIFRRQGARQTALTAAVLEPLSLLVAGAVVFVAVLAVMLPVFGLYAQYAGYL